LGLHHSPQIVTNGLVFCLDAGNTKSYPGSGTTWTDLSGLGNNGTLTNGPTFDSSNGGSIVFDGTNDYVTCGTDSSLNLTTALTLDVWCYLNGFGGGDFGRLIDRGNGTGTGYLFFVDNTVTNGTNGIRYISDNTGGTANGVVDLNVWQNFTLTHTGSTVNLYKNGVFFSTVPGSHSNITSGSRTLTIGGNVAATRAFDGNISNAKIYNRVLTATEIAQNYSALRGRFGI